MRLHQYRGNRGVGFTLRVLAALVFAGTGGLYTTPAVWAQAAMPQPGSQAEQRDRLDKAAARELLEQIHAAANEIQDHDHRTNALIAIARSYSGLADDATARELLSQVLIHTAEYPDTQIHFLYKIINATSVLADKNASSDLLYQLLATIQTLPDQEKAGVLTEITRYLSAPAVHSDLLEQILTAIQTTPDSLSKSRALTKVATVYATTANEARAIDPLAQALTVVDASDDSANSKYYTLLEVLEGAAQLTNTAKADLLPQALTVANNLQNQEYQSHALVYTAIFARQIPDRTTANALMEQALTLTESIEKDWERATALYVIASGYNHHFNEIPSADFLQRLFTAAREIQDDQYQLGGLLETVSLASKLQNQTVAKELLAQATTIVNGLEDSSNKAQGLIAIADSYRILSDETNARGLLLEALAVVKDVDDHIAKSALMGQFVLLSKSFQDRDMSDDLLRQGLDALETEPAVEVRLNGLLTTVGSHAGAIAGVTAMERLNQALTDIDTIQNHPMKIYTLLQATTLIRQLVYQPEITSEWDIDGLLNQVLEIAQKLDDSDEKSLVFSMIADMAAVLPEDANDQLVVQFLAAAQASPTAKGQVEILSAIAKIHINQQNETAAQTQLAQAQELTGRIPDEKDQAAALHRIAEIAAQLSNNTVAQGLMSQRLQLMEGMQDDYAQATGLTATIRAAHTLSDTASVQKLYGQAFAIANSLDIESEGYKADVLGTMATTLVKMASDT